MVKKITLLLLFTGTILTLQAQKKKDLLSQIDKLQDSISSLSDSISRANRQINISDSKAALFEKENTELRDANATLLENLSSFSQISKQNTETVNKALGSLKAKENQLKFITDDFSSNDSTAIAILTQAKQTLGPDAKIGVSDGDLIISNKLDFLFGSDSGNELTDDAKAFVVKIGELILANPNRLVYVEGMNITGEFELTYQQTIAVANSFCEVEGITPEKIKLLAKDGNFKEGINIRFTSDKNEFYKKLKAEFK